MTSAQHKALSEHARVIGKAIKRELKKNPDLSIKDIILMLKEVGEGWDRALTFDN